ncbi:MAG: phospho-N-acetylmuramoyl-pentapeptide-transferase [Bacteroidota bacterium]|nr:phospho-N-acetylmuramoyl-pentapeptide-transferase [Bacteroidota bacterium]
MIYHFWNFLSSNYDFYGEGIMQYVSVRAGLALFVSLLISLIFGGRIISILRKKQIGESIRDLGLEGQNEKAGTPTMGGIIILAAILIPLILFGDLKNIYTQLLIVSTIWMGLIGFLDDYIKVYRKNKKGLAGRFKILGQVGLGLIVGCAVYLHPEIYVKQEIAQHEVERFESSRISSMRDEGGDRHFFVKIKEPVTNIPFFKGNEFNYEAPLVWITQSEKTRKYAWLFFIPMVIFIIAAVSNGANLTDGLDGLATGTSAIVGVTLFVFAYVSSNIVLAEYFNVLYIPNSQETVVYLAAFIGACVGFLWYNSYPATVFMGDTGSLALGGIIASLAILLRKELLIPVLCAIFLIENISVILQVAYFKYTKRKTGVGQRIFLMSPLHHHYQKKGWHETKIVTRFWIIAIAMAAFSIITLKIR